MPKAYDPPVPLSQGSLGGVANSESPHPWSRVRPALALLA